MTSISFCMYVCRYVISCNLYVLTKLHVFQIIFMDIYLIAMQVYVIMCASIRKCILKYMYHVTPHYRLVRSIALIRILAKVIYLHILKLFIFHFACIIF